MPAFTESNKWPPTGSLPFPAGPRPGGADEPGPEMTFMIGVDAHFFDTNLLVCLFDADADEKKAQASARFETEVAAGRALLSTQVLQEFYVVVTRKLSVPLEPETAAAVVRNLSLLSVINIDTGTILAAIGRCQKTQLSFWDALERISPGSFQFMHFLFSWRALRLERSGREVKDGYSFILPKPAAYCPGSSRVSLESCSDEMVVGRHHVFN
jgi:predicted nucleic acid-binding protein